MSNTKDDYESEVEVSSFLREAVFPPKRTLAERNADAGSRALRRAPQQVSEPVSQTPILKKERRLDTKVRVTVLMSEEEKKVMGEIADQRPHSLSAAIRRLVQRAVRKELERRAQEG